MSASEILQILVGLLVGGDILATVALRGKLSAIAADLRLAITTLNEHSTTLAVQDSRIARLEAEFAAQKLRYDDLAGFLQGSGYRKRDGA